MTENAAPWVVISAAADGACCQIVRVCDGGVVEALRDKRGRKRLFSTRNAAWNKADQLNAHSRG
jgi:hypothetical protein